MTGDEHDALVNPYFYGVPVKDPDNFFGRDDQLQTIFEALAKGESISVVGERRSGRTSILYHLMTDAAHRAYGFDAQDFVFLYLDPQLGMRDPQEFYRELAEALVEQLPATAPRLPQDEVGRREVRSVLKSLQPRRLILLIDEFERLLGNQGFPVDFFTFLRGLLGEHEVRYVTATTQRLSDCYWGEWEGSPLYNVFRTVTLGAWTESEFDQFLTETSARSGAPMRSYSQEICKLAGRLPFYVQMACWLYFDAWRETNGRIRPDSVSIKRRFAEEARPHLERIWHKSLSPQERDALIAVACKAGKPEDSTLRDLTAKGYLVDGEVFSSAFTDLLLSRAAEPVAVVPPVAAEGPAEKGIWVNKRAGDVWVDGKQCEPPLTNLEYKLLLCLHDNANCICDKYEIVETVWAGGYIEKVDDSRIAKLVSRLRQRVESDPSHPRHVVTVHGRGYKLVTGGVS